MAKGSGSVGRKSMRPILEIVPLSATTQMQVRAVGGAGLDARDYIKTKRLTPYSRVRLSDGTVIIIERANGFVLTGRVQGGNRLVSVDLRNTNARIIGISEFVEQGTLF